MADPLKIALIGGGGHSRANHLPALEKYVADHPGEIQLSAFCDINPEVAEKVSREYKFDHSYTDVSDMLAAERLDGCIAITPIHITADVARRIISANIPLVIEKPPGATPEEAKEICDLVARAHARVMVSVNRRFDPAITAACEWRGNRPLDYLRTTMLRIKRSEKSFFTGTAIHCLDTMRKIAGNISGHSVDAWQVEGVWWYRVALEFESGTKGLLEVLPSCGTQAEFHEMFGAGYRLLARAGYSDTGEFTAWEDGKMVEQNIPDDDQLSFVRDGTYAETCEFISALKEGRSPYPSPAEVYPTVQLCHQIQQEVQK